MDLMPALVPSPLQTIQESIKRPTGRLLIVGDWFPTRSAEIAAPPLEAGETLEARRLEDVDDSSFDLILWRPVAGWNDSQLRRLAKLLAERGRLWIDAWAVHRRRLLLDLGRHGYAVIQDVPFQEPSAGTRCLLEIRHDGYTVRAFESGDEARILELFKPCFHVERSVEHFRWKYENNPWGRHLITLAESPDGELAAHYAGYPVPFYFASTGETLLALQIGDTMTDPRFRRAGRGVTSLLGRCFRHFFANHCDEKIAFNYGFNTGNIRRFNFQFIKGRLARC